MTHFSLTWSWRTTNNFLTWWQRRQKRTQPVLWKGTEKRSRRWLVRHRGKTQRTDGRQNSTIYDCTATTKNPCELTHDSATILSLAIKQLPQNCRELTYNWTVHDPYMPTREEPIQRIYFRDILIQDHYRAFMLMVCKSIYSSFALLCLTPLKKKRTHSETLLFTLGVIQ